MRIACLGGGPAGLYFAIAMKRRDPNHEIVVVERNRPADTFGWGVVLSDATLANLKASDPDSAAAIQRASRRRGSGFDAGGARIGPRILGSRDGR